MLDLDYHRLAIAVRQSIYLYWKLSISYLDMRGARFFSVPCGCSVLSL